MMGKFTRLLALLLLGLLALQLYFAARILLMNVLDPQSTSFQRSEIWRLASEKGQVLWSQQWVDEADLSKNLRRAVIASEDAGFAEHAGVDWDALEKAWERNQKAEARVERAEQRGRSAPKPKIVGGSTITQQLAKNLFLSGERDLLRKGQELVLTLMLEGLLSKQRILTIYLNNVEWGEGVFGAQAAARHYFRVDAARLSAGQAARLAVMLPAPKRFEKRPASPYVLSRAATIAARMGAVELPD
ncbi:monofunctional biosynthetic peptidoglycan transglycosylase [Paucibacter sp. PLA-PC-4]|nr:monofunctional biosynthetic peptidoglycan transglycosylase [Paucibacter sp. PLA-PC-4]MCX2861315.1 monofunctional biosynthetic peptidoglycan transglycosylase [Paucibacter sp. PLA-PC-4]